MTQRLVHISSNEIFINFIHVLNEALNSTIIFSLRLPFADDGEKTGDFGDVGEVADGTNGRLPEPCLSRFAALMLCFVGGGGRAWGTIPLGVGLDADSTICWGENVFKSGDDGGLS